MQTRKERFELKNKTESNRMKNKLMTSLHIGAALLGALTVNNDATDLTEVKTVHATGNVKSRFLNKISNQAQKIAADNDLYASVMIAQAALESGWGQSKLAQEPNHNLFGIKGEYNGQSVDMKTLEDDGGGNYYQINDKFRKYNNYAQSLQDYADLLTGKDSDWRYNFYKGARTSTTNNYQEATNHLTGRYATDTRYGTKLNKIIEENDLTRFDSKVSVFPTANQQPATTSVNYSIKSGDTLYAIAKRYGVSVSDLQKANSISGSLIHPGQQLVIPGQTSQAAPAQQAQASNQSQTTGQTQTTNQTQSSPASTSASYSIKSGDTLYSIAKRYGVSVSDLQKANSISGSLIHPGQQLVIPGQTSQAPAQQAQASNQNQTTGQTQTTNQTQSSPASTSARYSIKSGDTLYSIAKRHGVSIQSLKDANSITGNMIYAGQNIVIPGASQPAAPAQQTTQETSANVDNTSQPTYTNDDAVAPLVPTTEAQPQAQEETPAPAGSHTVQNGDTLYSIARRNGQNVNDLIAQNGGSTLIIPGQVISW